MTSTAREKPDGGLGHHRFRFRFLVFFDIFAFVFLRFFNHCVFVFCVSRSDVFGFLFSTCLLYLSVVFVYGVLFLCCFSRFAVSRFCVRVSRFSFSRSVRFSLSGFRLLAFRFSVPFLCSFLVFRPRCFVSGFFA